MESLTIIFCIGVKLSHRQRHLQKMLAFLEEGVGSVYLACTMLKAILTTRPHKEEEFKTHNISSNNVI